MSDPRRLLLKLRPTASLAAVPASANLRPLFAGIVPGAELELTTAPTWFLADLPDGGPTPWDLAHSQVARQLGLAPSDILFIEPDLAQGLYRDVPPREVKGPVALDIDCSQPKPQTAEGGRIMVPGLAWHLGKNFSQLQAAREEMGEFHAPRTMIAHIDTGYDRNHEACPAHVRHDLERNFVDGDDNPKSAQDKDFSGILDNSGHGTGTLGILAGGALSQLGNLVLGGAPEADVVPLRIANRVILFYTSVLAQALRYALQIRADVVSLSMGGLPSKAWNEVINQAYEAGLCIVAAAGNNYGGLPTRHVVYPARYRRTIAACGAMGNYQPYYGLAHNVLQGNFGPKHIMVSALAAYTPNIPWPKFGCPQIVDLDGQGTSAATPQIAAAVALWYERYKSVLPRDWRRVEAVRYALFETARRGDATYFGRGILQAKEALGLGPFLNLSKTQSDRDSFAFWRVLTGLGIAEEPPREQMFNLELTQRWFLRPELQQLVPEPEAEVPLPVLQQAVDVLLADPELSQTLRRHLLDRYNTVFKAPVPGAVLAKAGAPQPAFTEVAATAKPACRRLRIYAMDPSFAGRFETAPISAAVLQVRWEALTPGPTGEYVAVIDEEMLDEASKITYPAVNLDDAHLLAQDGCPPSEGNPAFHQQMVYAVVMKTVDHFERALGRPVLWRHGSNPKDDADDSIFVPRLRIYPHAYRQANAYYSPQEIALKFGYFAATAADLEYHVPGQRIFSCLSHDIIVHETTHAILDGMQRRFREATNPDVLAFHEAFADIIALMQHFTIPEILAYEIRRTRGNLEAESILGSLAVQFGRAIGRRGALREAIGSLDAQGGWQRLRPNPLDYQTVLAPHSRGAILVAAVFDAFLTIYKSRTADLMRLSSGGSGVLAAGAIHPDLVDRLAAEAAKTAGHILNMCIRALDYLPPVDITFYEYLRGLITADQDLVSDDRYNYRLAFIEAFRRRGILPYQVDPQDAVPLAEETLRWRGIDLQPFPKAVQNHLRGIVALLKRYADACFYLTDRRKLFQATRRYRQLLHKPMTALLQSISDDKERQLLAQGFGLDATLPLEVHELRRAIRIGPTGRHQPQVMVALTQSRPFSEPTGAGNIPFRGGATLIVDLSQPGIQYAIFKDIDSRTREARTLNFLQFAAADPLRTLLFLDQQEPFVALHQAAEGDYLGS
uniref:S8 family serine peptidase n=1 Tax=Desulfobacca sp. TaxID=2067990 RepID=UPI004049EF2C